jgi:hypothetical protein
MKYLIAIIAVLSATSAGTAQELTGKVPPFYSAQQCDTFQEVARLSKQFNEDTLFNGKMIQQHASGQYVTSEFVFTVNQDSGTWSILALFPNGIACQVASGFDFEPYTK